MVIVGYHGCSRELGFEVVNKKTPLEPKNKPYHWLGDGAYFWENDPHRALEWAHEKASRGELQDPFVIGAAIDLGRCLDLHVRRNQALLLEAFLHLEDMSQKIGVKIRDNMKAPKDQRDDKVLRYRDCAVINHLNGLVAPFDTVRGLFIEGDPIYPGANLYAKTHSEIAVRNLNCIIGYFIPDQPSI